MTLYSRLEGTLSYGPDVDESELSRVTLALLLADFSYATRHDQSKNKPELDVLSRGIGPGPLLGEVAIRTFLITEGRLPFRTF
jgi:hypothetical protein